MERVGETVVAVGTNDERFIILGENERSDRNCGDLVGKDREQMFNLSTVSNPCEAPTPLISNLHVGRRSSFFIFCGFLDKVKNTARHQTRNTDVAGSLGIKIENMWNHLEVRDGIWELNNTRRSEK